MMKAVVFLWMSLLAVAVPLNGAERLVMRVSPSIAMAPAWVTVLTTVESDTENRALQVIFESADFYRSSTIQLDGDDRMAKGVATSWNWFSRRFRLLAGSFIFCDAAVFRKIGGFNNEFFASEELDLTKRLKQFARGTEKRIVILYRNPLVTSARKLQLYTPWEMFWFCARTMVTGGRSLKNRQSCHVWYDGRR